MALLGRSTFQSSAFLNSNYSEQALSNPQHGAEARNKTTEEKDNYCKYCSAKNYDASVFDKMFPVLW